jgi:membrane associated rhomboid family serine protease
MFPLRDDNPGLRTPWVTLILIGANLLTWALLEGFGFGTSMATAICELGLIPGEITQRAEPGTLFQLTQATACRLGATPPWHTLVTSMFLHGSWFHLIGNLWFLWVFGNNVEDGMGSFRFLVFYLLTGLLAAGLQIAWDPASTVPMVGASGAIGGVMGAYLVMYPRVRVHMLIFLGFYVTRIAVPAFTVLAYWLFFQLVGGFTSVSGGGGMAFWAHIGGFLGGMALVFVFRSRSLVAHHPYHGWSRRRD